MTTLLKINTSIFSDNGYSSQLANQFAAAWQEEHPTGNVVERDLVNNPVPHLDKARYQAFIAKPEERTAEQKAVVAYSDMLIKEIQAADVIVLGVPMYNFGAPSTLKSYFDHIARAGVTFRYTENGPLGLLKDRPVYAISTRGGIYAGTGHDSQSPFIRDILAFLGITSVEFIYAEGLGVNDAMRDGALARARHRLKILSAEQLL